MENNIEKKLEQVKEYIPEVNPNLGKKIYYETINTKKEKKTNLSFFNIPFKFVFPSIVVVIVALMIGVFNRNGNSNANSDSSNSNQNSTLNSAFKPPLSSSKITTFNFTGIFGQTNSEYDIVTVQLDNSLHNQVIYLTSYEEQIVDISLNNGNVSIEKVEEDDVVFYKLTVYNYNCTSHYINIVFEKGTINKNSTSNIKLLALTNLKKPYKSYEFNLSISKIIFEGIYYEN